MLCDPQPCQNTEECGGCTFSFQGEGTTSESLQPSMSEIWARIEQLSRVKRPPNHDRSELPPAVKTRYVNSDTLLPGDSQETAGCRVPHSPKNRSNPCRTRAQLPTTPVNDQTATTAGSAYARAHAFSTSFSGPARIPITITSPRHRHTTRHQPKRACVVCTGGGYEPHAHDRTPQP